MVCGEKTKKNGTTSAGKIRYRCTVCGASQTQKRPAASRNHQLEALVQWLISTKTQAEIQPEKSSRSFRRHTQWAWKVQPVITPTGEVFDEVQLDGIYLEKDHVCLIAYADGHVVDYQWATTENSTAWSVLLQRIPVPAVVVIDGGSGLAKALDHQWPQTRIQRCLVHIQRNVRQYLTLRPRTDAGRELADLSRRLTRITTLEEASVWAVGLAGWYSRHQDMLNEKTWATDPLATKRWWWTHQRLRKAYNLLNTQLRKQTLFQYLQPELLAQVSGVISSTTNQIEGGTNAGLREMLLRHRGLRLDRRKRAVEWWLQQHTSHPQPPSTFIRETDYDPSKNSRIITEEPLGPALYDTSFSWEDGTGIQHGWAGRHQ